MKDKIDVITVRVDFGDEQGSREDATRRSDTLVEIMTQGGKTTWICPGCEGNWSCLHFDGDAVKRQTHKEYGIRSDCLVIPLCCEHGHYFKLALDVCSGSLWVSIENFTTDEEAA
jgi:hypothetical protein